MNVKYYYIIHFKSDPYNIIRVFMLLFYIIMEVKSYRQDKSRNQEAFKLNTKNWQEPGSNSCHSILGQDVIGGIRSIFCRISFKYLIFRIFWHVLYFFDFLVVCSSGLDFFHGLFRSYNCCQATMTVSRAAVFSVMGGGGRVKRWGYWGYPDITII